MTVDYIDDNKVPFRCTDFYYKNEPDRKTHILEIRDIDIDFNDSRSTYKSNNHSLLSLKHFLDNNKNIKSYEFLNELIESGVRDNLIMALTIINQL